MRTLTAGIVVAVATVLAVWRWSDGQESRPTEASLQSEQRLKMSLMTSLPLIWSDGASMADIIDGRAGPAPIYSHWQERYDVQAVDSLENLAASKSDVVLLAQPGAMDPADLATLDDWVRAGGRAVILADPALTWHSHYPLGDNRRPLVTSLLSPLLDHWGLELIAPEDEGAGAVDLEMDGLTIASSGIGTFQLSNDSQCSLSAGRVLAQCTIGEGRALLLADADFLNSELWETQTGSAAVQLTDQLVARVMK